MKPRSERDHYTYVARVEDAAKSVGGTAVEWRSGRHQKRDPWSEQERIRAAWREIAENLRTTGAREDIALADDVDAFVDRMPPIQTQQQQIALRLLELRREKRIAQHPAVPVKAAGASRQDQTREASVSEKAGSFPAVNVDREPGRER